MAIALVQGAVDRNSLPTTNSKCPLSPSICKQLCEQPWPGLTAAICLGSVPDIVVLRPIRQRTTASAPAFETCHGNGSLRYGGRYSRWQTPKRYGATNLSSRLSSQSSHGSLHNQKLRGTASALSLRPDSMVPKDRQSSLGSLTGYFDSLRINDHVRGGAVFYGNQAVSEQAAGPPALEHHSGLPMEDVTFRSRHKVEASPNRLLRKKQSMGSAVVPPKTPVPTTKEVQAAMAGMEAVLVQCKTPRTPAMSPSPTKPAQRFFLTKDSNTRGFTAWDVDERLDKVESQFMAMKEVMNGSLTDRKALEETVDLAKTRGLSPEAGVDDQRGLKVCFSERTRTGAKPPEREEYNSSNRTAPAEAAGPIVDPQPGSRAEGT